MRRRIAVGVVASIAGAISLTLCHPPVPVAAKVEVVTGATVMTDEATVKDLLATLERAEQATFRREIWTAC